jgi:hypothetical protein
LGAVGVVVTDAIAAAAAIGAAAAQPVASFIKATLAAEVDGSNVAVRGASIATQSEGAAAADGLDISFVVYAFIPTAATGAALSTANTSAFRNATLLLSAVGGPVTTAMSPFILWGTGTAGTFVSALAVAISAALSSVSLLSLPSPSNSALPVPVNPNDASSNDGKMDPGMAGATAAVVLAAVFVLALAVTAGVLRHRRKAKRLLRQQAQDELGGAT